MHHKPLTDEEIKKETMHLDWMKGNYRTEYEDGSNHKQLFKFVDRLLINLNQLKEECQLRWNEGESAISQCAKLELDIKCLEESRVDKKAFEQVQKERDKLKQKVAQEKERVSAFKSLLEDFEKEYDKLKAENENLDRDYTEMRNCARSFQERICSLTGEKHPESGK